MYDFQYGFSMKELILHLAKWTVYRLFCLALVSNCTCKRHMSSKPKAFPCLPCLIELNWILDYFFPLMWNIQAGLNTATVLGGRPKQTETRLRMWLTTRHILECLDFSWTWNRWKKRNICQINWTTDSDQTKPTIGLENALNSKGYFTVQTYYSKIYGCNH